MLHALPDASRHVRAIQKNHPKTRRQPLGSRRRDHTRLERRPFPETGRRGTTHPQCDSPRRRTTHPQRLGRRAALLRLYLPEVLPLSHSTPALSPTSYPQISQTSQKKRIAAPNLDNPPLTP